ncbi:AcrR family transcriptional regulator [Actinoplanes lutulentus]|uniref:TetR family transcriptional regulator n=1 Tax=Actinoplanes lutulentus TaxID=1287878 RepID=A0A327Z4H4_9ACTN|nr:TetR/AcrR family transcriptional regulator [Actinoplanes lutulentus]MBB2946977.1 AcrR family transcriptional regulator [Actinoplanes lutulentus]RAK30479.1 TetR family transcriptional regulator [Actinoplanes lutulentus]
MRQWTHYPALDLSPILAVSLDQIVRHGYDATSVRKIAAEVGVTVPALYYHFENKQAILMALLDHAMTTVTAHVDAAVAEAGPDPVARLSGAVEAIVLYMAHHRDLAFLDSERRSLSPANLARYVEHRDRIEGLLRDAIVSGCRAGVFRTPAPAVCGRAILAMCQGVAGWFDPSGPKKAEETAADYVRIALAAVESA